MLSPVWFPVPPGKYGGIEAIVSLLTEGLAARGVDVTLFASGDSTTTARHVHVFDEAPSERIGETFWELNHALACLDRLDEFDLVHDHTGLLGLTLFGLADVPLAHTVHGPLAGVPGDMYRTATAVVRDVGLISLTLAQRRPFPEAPWLANIPNAIELGRYPFDPHPGDGLLFLGRMSPDKGAHTAIEVARACGRPLRIAAKCREPEEQAYFDRAIDPQLGDGIEYVGEVSHEEKCRLLAEAHAVLVPIEWEEPFGLVMVEAMASGTPPIAMRRGSVPEVIDHERTGFIVDDVPGMAAAVERAAELDPLELRREAAERFSPDRMVDAHLEAYEQLLAEGAAASARLASVG